MNKKIARGLLLLALGLPRSARAQSAPGLNVPEAVPVKKAEAPRTWKYVFGYDYFFPLNAGEGLKNQLNTRANTLTTQQPQPYDSAFYSVSTRGGVGARFGAMRPIDKRTDMGATLGYVNGPTMNSNFTAVSGVLGPGGTTINRTVVLIRGLGHVQVNFPVKGRLSLNLGSGFGWAYGQINQTCNSSGSVACAIASDRRAWSGFTWEFSPGLSYGLKYADINLGLRYAGFPKFKGNDQIASLDWQTVGIFLGASF